MVEGRRAILQIYASAKQMLWLARSAVVDCYLQSRTVATLVNYGGDASGDVRTLPCEDGVGGGGRRRGGERERERCRL